MASRARRGPRGDEIRSVLLSCLGFARDLLSCLNQWIGQSCVQVVLHTYLCEADEEEVHCRPSHILLLVSFPSLLIALRFAC